MSLSSPNLDDLRFQSDLVDEARKRIIHYCPEWTEYNLSDPGITLIELFAWMTEMIVYRLNQVPEKNYGKFLELLGLQRRPASSARTDLTFWLSVSLPISPDNQDPVVVPQGTQITLRNPEEEMIFTTDRTLTVIPPRLTQLRREQEVVKNYAPRLGVEIFYPFDRNTPREGDTFYLGFDEQGDLRGHILRLAFTCEATQAVGIRREDPPWVWECSMGDGRWLELGPSRRSGEKDTTGGLNNPTGSLVLYLPLDMQPDQVHGRRGFWLRCRIERRRPEQGMYTESPQVTDVRAEVLGAAVPASHAVVIEDELLGRSTGDAGQRFRLTYAPILEPVQGETVEVEEKQYGELVFVPWRRVDNFAHSDLHDRHFVIDTATGEIAFGPAIRQPDGTVRRYGRVPETGCRIRITRYRRGGGALGNVPAGALQVMMTSLSYISRAENLLAAAGGSDAEELEEVKARAQRELQTHRRAVTAEDYEQLAYEATVAVARAKCNAPRQMDGHLPPGSIELLLVPAAVEGLRAGDLSALRLHPSLVQEVEAYLDKRRLVSTSLQIMEPKYLGVRARAKIVPVEYADPDLIQARVLNYLQAFISPLALDPGLSEQEDLMGPGWKGWPFGRSLYAAEVFSLIQRVPGVKHVLEVQLETRPIVPREEGDEDREPPVLDTASQNIVRVTEDTLLCSLDHEIVLAELGG